MEKSNIFAYAELQKLILNLESPGSPLKKLIISQAAYSHILEPKYFSEPLAPRWESIRERMGYSEAQTGQLLRSTVQAKMELLSEKECREITAKIKEIFEEIKAEL
jgi:hypothetical protein